MKSTYSLTRLSPVLALVIPLLAGTAALAPSMLPAQGLHSHAPASRGEGQIIFTDVTATAGVGLPQTLNESVAWGDYDRDGDEDLYLTNDGPNRLFRNDGNSIFSDVTAIVGVGNDGFSVGTAFGDLDNDGDLDLFVVNFTGGRDVLYRNNGPIGVGGETTFTDVAIVSGIDQTSSSRGMAFVDIDSDGLLDIYVNAIGSDVLYRNQGDLNFVATLVPGTASQGVGIVATDIDSDGWLDLFTGNRSGDPNRLFLNDQGALVDITVAAGIDKTGLGMGVLSIDYDNDLDFDLYWTTWPGSGLEPVPNAFYQNQGDHTFVDRAVETLTTDPFGWGISCNAGDIDNDGWEDFLVTNGFSGSSTANVLFHNQGGSFSDATALLGGGDFDGRGVAFADYDNDGDLDLLVTAGSSALTRLWRNDSTLDNHWLLLHLEGGLSNRSAIGARIEVKTDLQTVTKEVSSGAGRGSFNSLPVEFGLGSATEIREVRIYWPSGAVESVTGVGLDQRLEIAEMTLFLSSFERSDVSRWSTVSP